MKKIKVLVLLILVTGFSADLFAQANATATSSSEATIVTPLAIANVWQLNFGNIAVNTVSNGTVILDPSAAATRTPSGGVTLPLDNGTVTAAKFSVTGTDAYAYTLTLPGGGPTGTTVITIANASSSTDVMTIDTWTSSLSSLTGGLLDGTGQQIVYIGAKLHVSSSQLPGDYKSSFTGGSGDFTITVNYN
ncbi:MAG: DUF4402 domain-containing protein [Bacteroidia bacterium]|nr:DUF4402 domain-containing protein [Bacteroidia bacterium]